jgi:hypothetical protein
MFKQLLAACALAIPTVAYAQSTTFTYQGQLRDAGQPAAGLHDLRFTLFDAAAGGAQVGSTQCIDNILVSEGLLTATIDFGQQFAAASSRFLQVEVRADTGLTCGNLAGFITLGDRQPVTAAPIASHAKSASTAFSLSAPDGTPANAVVVDNDGRVGIGTAAPIASLHIASDLDAVMVLQDTGPNSTQSGFVSFKNSSGTETAWVGYGTPGSPHFSIVNARSGGNLALLPIAGNVGIGTTAPTVKLEVHGDIRLGSSGQLRAAAGDENLRLLRGSVSGSGAVRAGTGFTVAHVGVGQYTITFTTPFVTVPAVVVGGNPSPNFSVMMTAWAHSPTISGVQVRVVNTNGTLSDLGFDFIAMGPR